MRIEDIAKYKKIIDDMDHFEMARIYRFDAIGHIYFDTTKPLYKYFMKKFKSLGGMTTSISKEVGW